MEVHCRTTTLVAPVDTASRIGLRVVYFMEDVHDWNSKHIRAHVSTMMRSRAPCKWHVYHRPTRNAMFLNITNFSLVYLYKTKISSAKTLVQYIDFLVFFISLFFSSLITDILEQAVVVNITLITSSSKLIAVEPQWLLPSYHKSCKWTVYERS